MTPWPGPTHPTGPAGPGPSGPAGPGPQPSGPAPGGPQQPSPTSGTGAPWPSRPQGPTGPSGPTGPGRGLAALIADAEAQLSGPLHLLANAAAELPDNDPARRGLNAAAAHLNCALIRLARLNHPARQEPSAGAHDNDTLSAPGGPGPDAGRGGEGPGSEPGRPGRFSLPQMPPVPPWVETRRRLAEVGVGPVYDFRRGVR